MANDNLKQALKLVEETIDMWQAKFDEMSEAQQDGEKGQKLMEDLDALSDIQSELEKLIA